jgi:hypothetical protein
MLAMKRLGGLRGGHLTHARFVHRDESGQIIWASDWVPNALADEGERNILDVYLRNQFAPSGFYVRLFADTPVETDSLASLTGEPGGLVGYAPQPVLRSASAGGWPVLSNEFSGGDYQAESATVSFKATGTWPTITHAVLATSSNNTGLLIDYTALPQPRTLRSGQQLDIVYAPRLS